MSCCLLNLCCLIPRARAHYCTKKVARNAYLCSQLYTSTSSWMSNLSDDTMMSSLNIPGTHDSMARYKFFGVSAPICQKWNLLEQLNAGIRYFDIRVKEDLKQLLPIHHGISFQKTYLEADVIRVIEAFLKDNPRETVIITMRIEERDKEAPTLTAGFEKIVEKSSNRDLFSFASQIVKLGTLRGKIWLWPGENWNYQGFQMSDQMKAGHLIRQDQYEAGILVKKRVFQETNDAAAKAIEDRNAGRVMYLNQANAAVWYKWPFAYAEAMNAFILKQMLVQGIVAMDFPGEQLIKTIIESNFKAEEAPAAAAAEDIGHKQTIN